MEISNIELGSGAYGQVLCGKVGDQKCAIKKTPFRYVGDPDFQACIREIVAANLVVSPGVQPLTHVGISDSAIYFASPIQSCSLAAFISKCRVVSPDIIRQLAYELVCGLKAQHDAGLAHRDIKPHNILVDTDGHLRYIDFGASCLISAPHKLYTLKCTATTRSPEEFLGLECGFASDLWSLGMTIMYIVLGNLNLGLRMDGTYRTNVKKDDDDFDYFTGILSRMLFPGPDEWPEAWAIIDRRYSRISKFMRSKIAKRSGTPSAVGYLRRIMRCRRDLPPEFFDFIAGFLQGKPDCRMSLQTALEHPYFKDMAVVTHVCPTVDYSPTYKSIPASVRVFTMKCDRLASADILAEHPDLNKDMIIAMKKWLAELVVGFKYRCETLTVGLELFDRYMSWSSHVTQHDLQLIGLACMFLSASVFQDEDIYTYTWISKLALRPTVLKFTTTVLNILYWSCGQLVVANSPALCIGKRGWIGDVATCAIRIAERATWPGPVEEFFA